MILNIILTIKQVSLLSKNFKLKISRKKTFCLNMKMSYLSYTTSDHPPNYQSFITILIFRKKVAHYMILLKLLSCIKASFSLQKRRDILMNLGAITLLPLSYSIAVCDILHFFNK